MEEAAGAAYRWNPCREAESAIPGTPVLVRYADDLVALCDSREQAEEAKARLVPWLAARGLAFNEEKTRVVHLDEGFDFLTLCRPPRYADLVWKLLVSGGERADEIGIILGRLGHPHLSDLSRRRRHGTKEQRGAMRRDHRTTGTFCRRLQGEAESPGLCGALSHLRAEAGGAPQPMAGGAPAQRGRPEQGAA